MRMRLTDLHSRLSGAVGDDAVLPLTPEQFPEAAPLLGYLQISRLLVRAAQVSLADGTVSLAGTADVAGTSAGVTLTATGEDTPQLALRLDLPSHWTFADSFPGLPPSFKADPDHASFTSLSPSLLYDLAFTAPALTARASSIGGAPAGLTFSGTTALPAAYAHLKTQFGIPDLVTISGEVTLAVAGPASVDLAFSAPPTTVTVASLAVHDALLHLRTVSGEDRGGRDLTVLECEGRMDIGTTDPLPVQVTSVYEGDHGVFDFEARPQRGALTLSRGIDAVVELAGGEAGEFSLPESLKVLDSFYLDLIAAQVDTRNAVVGRLNVRAATDATWKVVDGMEVGDLRFGWMLLYPFSRARHVSTWVGGTLTFGTTRKVRFDVTATKEFGFTIAGSLRPGDSIDLTELVETALGFTADLPAISVDALEIDASTTGDFTVAGTLSSDWTVDVDDHPLALRSVSFRLEKSGGAVRALLDARMDVAGTLLFTRATVEPAPAAATGAPQTDVTFEGGTLPGGEPIHLTAVVAWLLEMVGITLPSDVPDVLLDNLDLRFNTATREFHFEGETTAPLPISLLAGGSIHAAVDLTSSVDAAGKRTLLGSMEGDLTLGGSVFTLQYTMGQAADTLAASWQAKSAEDSLEFEEIAGLFGFDMPELPEGLRLSLKQASFTYDFTHKQLVLTAQSQNYGTAAFVADASGDPTRFLFGLALGTGISLTDLPVVGQAIPPELAFSIDAISLWLSSDSVDAEYAGALGRLLPAGGPALPAAGLGAGATLSVDLRLGEAAHTLTLGTAAPQPAALQAGAGAGAPGAVQPAAATATDTDTTVVPGTPSAAIVPSNPAEAQVPGAAAPVSPARPAPKRAEDGATWLDLQKTLGPLSLQRIGFRYRDGRIAVLFDGGISMAGFSFSLMGLQVSSALQPPLEVALGLDGLGLEVDRDPLLISGAFLRADEPGVDRKDWKYAGLVNVRIRDFGLAAVGVYASRGGQSSLFVFGSMDTPLGGPPAFFVTGLSAGVGFNSKVRVPGQDEVQDFPLVAGLSAAPREPGQQPDPLAVLDRLQGTGTGRAPWITDEPGHTWIAAGVQFTSFKMVNTRALLLANLGERDLSFALLGLSQAQLPPSGDKLFAQVGLQLAAVFKPLEGFLGVTAVLTRDSWLLDPACRLTGGFALFLWFDGPHEGDFVLTVGGYHPSFSVPAHYPRVERLGFNWKVSDSVTLKGGTYFALTPSCIMAGVALEATYSSGDLKAWFRASADFLAQWHPFHFDARVAVSVGASYRMSLLFTTVTLSVEIGAELHLWGPPTGGTVHVDWAVISFTIPFGEQPGARPATLGWAEFGALLPPRDAWLTLNLEGVQAGAGGERLARPDDLSFSTRSAIPATELAVAAPDSPAAPARRTIQQMGTLSIRPMGITDVDTPQTVTVTRDGAVVDLQKDGWTVEAVTQNHPQALWGAPLKDGRPAAPEANLLRDQLVGLRVHAPRARAGFTPGPIDVAGSLGYDAVPSQAPLPLQPDAQQGGPASVADPGTVSDIAATAGTDAARQARNAAYRALTLLGAAPPAPGELPGVAR